jgi:DNA-binding PadR family transcriptional regulator
VVGGGVKPSYVCGWLYSALLAKVPNYLADVQPPWAYTSCVYPVCIVLPMSLGHSLLGLLEQGPSHGYDLKRAYDKHFGNDRSLHYGQVYTTLSRLLRNGLVEEAGVQAGEGPERKRYAITDAGVTDVDQWLRTPEKPEQYLQNTLYGKVVLALLSHRSATEVLDVQRAAHLNTMRELTRRKLAGDLADQLICDHALFHLEADLRWLELTAARLDELSREVKP